MVKRSTADRLSSPPELIIENFIQKEIEDFTGAGVYYGAAMTEASACKDKSVYFVGGGNSTGQSAVYLSKFVNKVHIVVRRDGLSETMSAYLIQQINNIRNIEVLSNTQITEVIGNKYLEKLAIENLITYDKRTEDAAALYIFIGAKPYMEWLCDIVQCDPKGFIETGHELMAYKDFTKQWNLESNPFLLETCISGIFAAGMYVPVL